MFTNASCVLLKKGIDGETRLPTWEEVKISPVYWENKSGQLNVSNHSGAHEMKENDSVFVIIPKRSVPDVMPQKEDLIVYGDDGTDKKNTHTITSVASFLYGSEAVQHIEVTAI